MSKGIYCKAVEDPIPLGRVYNTYVYFLSACPQYLHRNIELVFFFLLLPALVCCAPASGAVPDGQTLLCLCSSIVYVYSKIIIPDFT